MSRGVILYGPPAVGKDTIDVALRRRRGEYAHFARIKVGSGRTEGYRFRSVEDLEQIRARGEVVWENSRYAATYVVDLPGLRASLAIGVPILHLGQSEAVSAVLAATEDTRWTVVDLWCPEEVARLRLDARGDRDVADRIGAWHQTPALTDPDLRLDTSDIEPAESARRIDVLVHAGGPSPAS